MCSIVSVAILAVSTSRVGLRSLCIAEGFSESLQQEGDNKHRLAHYMCAERCRAKNVDNFNPSTKSTGTNAQLFLPLQKRAPRDKVGLPPAFTASPATGTSAFAQQQPIL